MDTSYLEKQVSTIVTKLHELFDEIGIPSHERDSRESELFAALSETLHNQLRLVTNEKSSLTEEAEKIITTIKQLNISLEGSATATQLDLELKVTYPLKACLQVLKEKQIALSRQHHERFEQVKKLAVAIDSYSSHLEPTFIKVQLPPLSPNATIPPTFDLSHSYFSNLDQEFTRVYEEYQKRINTVATYSAEIITLWAELGTPQAQTDSNIVEYGRESPEQLGLHPDDLQRLKGKRDRLVDEKKAREKRLKDVKNQIEQLWERLCIAEDEQKQFISRNRGCGMRTINEFEEELSRLNELKRQNLGLFVEESRIRLQGLWDGLYFSEEEMLEFTPAFSDVYSDALLSAHEAEIARLEALKQQRAPILDLVDKHRSLINEREQLQNASQDGSRLMLRGQKGEKRDPGKLLREEKMRKRITKELPKVELDLKKALECWEDEYGRPFLVVGERYLDELECQAKVAAPPRSKTPSNLNHGRNPPKSTKAAAPSSNLRSKTPTNFNTIRGNPHTSNSNTNTTSHKPTASKGNISPSRIPGARAPLSSTHGNKSPNRNYQTMPVNKNMGPPRMPPPKMKDLFIPPESHQQQQQYTPTLMSKSTTDLERSASIVRQIAPEDPYNDISMSSHHHHNHHHHHPSQNLSRSAYQYSTTNMPAPHQSRSTAMSTASSSASSVENHPHYGSHQAAAAAAAPSNYGRVYSHAPPAPSRPESRQISGTSMASMTSGASAASGSENWETLDNSSVAGDEAAGADDEFYARLRAQQQQQNLIKKRLSPQWDRDDVKRLRSEWEVNV